MQLSRTYCHLSPLQSRYSTQNRYHNTQPLRNAVFWNVTPCGFCKYRRFGGTYRLQHQGERIIELGTLAVNNNWSTRQSWFLAWLVLWRDGTKRMLLDTWWEKWKIDLWDDVAIHNDWKERDCKTIYYASRHTEEESDRKLRYGGVSPGTGYCGSWKLEIREGATLEKRSALLFGLITSVEEAECM
jgi:hypothetical protein